MPEEPPRFCRDPPVSPPSGICVGKHRQGAGQVSACPGAGQAKEGARKGLSVGKTMVCDVYTLTIVGGDVYLSKFSKW